MISICIPAYRSEAFIHETLSSALSQTHADIHVILQIEPPADATIAACRDLLDDSRIQVRVNEERLGWAENVSELISVVTTPYFCVLAHDDWLYPQYIERLWETLCANPQAVCAYSDVEVVHGEKTGLRSIQLDQSSPSNRLTSFLARGMIGAPWRGLTRKAALKGARFPVDKYGGFLVENEWAFKLAALGPVTRVPQMLYRKIVRSDQRVTASSGRSRKPLAERTAAIQNHFDRLIDTADAVLTTPPERLDLALAIEASRVSFLLSRDCPDAAASRSPRLSQLLEKAQDTGSAPVSRRSVAMALCAQASLGRHELLACDWQDLALKAQQMDPELSWAHALTARVHALRGDREAAHQACERISGAVSPCEQTTPPQIEALLVENA